MVVKTETFSGSLDDVRAFCAVVDFGSISAAARELAETKGSVSRRITRLENTLGTKLLRRCWSLNWILAFLLPRPI
jgi:hypothetical protein